MSKNSSKLIHHLGIVDGICDEVQLIQESVMNNREDLTAKNAKGAKSGLLLKEFGKRAIPFQPQVELQMHYKGEQLEQTYKPDFICYDKIIVEIKAVKVLASEHKAQLLNYLKATGLELGLLVNFGSYPKVEIIRMANSNFRDFSAFRGSTGGAK